MSGEGDPDDGGLDLAALRSVLSPLGVRIGARRIRAGDEAAFVGPGATASGANLARRRASGAARIAARRVLAALGSDASAPLPRLPSGAPLWPADVVGSLAHDDEFAVAAAALKRDAGALGVDVEPAEPLPADILDLALSARERRGVENDPVRARLIFCAKEAVYKAINALDGSPLEYDDIEIRLADGTAVLRDGRSPRLFVEAGERLLVVALA